MFEVKYFLNSDEYAGTSHEELCAIYLGISRGLGALHLEHSSHGDWKPANILLYDALPNVRTLSVPNSWIPKLYDFGSATVSRATEASYSKQKYRGTVGWRPPKSYSKIPPGSLQLCDVFRLRSHCLLRVYRPFHLADACQGQPR